MYELICTYAYVQNRAKASMKLCKRGLLCTVQIFGESAPMHLHNWRKIIYKGGVNWVLLLVQGGQNNWSKTTKVCRHLMKKKQRYIEIEMREYCKDNM